MGVGLLLRSTPIKRGLLSRPASAQDLFKEVSRVLPRLASPLSASFSTADEEFLADLHPAEEPVFFTSPTPGVLCVEAKTSTAGPGYHMWLCGVIESLAKEMRFDWEPPSEDFLDETGYFHDRDKARLFAEMDSFRKALFGHVVDSPREPGGRLAIGLPPTLQYRMPGTLHTVLGPRDLAWAESMVADGDPREFWPWYDEGTGASFRLGLAKTLLWREVRWRPPLDDQEKNLLAQVDSLLTEASRDLPEAIPWREWKELREYIGKRDALDRDIAARAAEATGTLIGYRRHDVVAHCGPWRFTYPGSKKESDEGGRFEAHDEDSWIGATLFSSPDGVGDDPGKGMERVGHPDERVTAFRVRNDSEQGCVVSALYGVGTDILLLTSSGEPEHYDAMVRVAESVRYQK